TLPLMQSGNDAARLASLIPIARSLPKTIAAALDHRISRLSDACRLLLGNAAILGGSFEYPIICAMGIEKSGGIAADEDGILDVLDEALQAGVLTEEGTGADMLCHF